MFYTVLYIVLSGQSRGRDSPDQNTCLCTDASDTPTQTTPPPQADPLQTGTVDRIYRYTHKSHSDGATHTTTKYTTI